MRRLFWLHLLLSVLLIGCATQNPAVSSEVVETSVAHTKTPSPEPSATPIPATVKEPEATAAPPTSTPTEVAPTVTEAPALSPSPPHTQPPATVTPDAPKATDVPETEPTTPPPTATDTPEASPQPSNTPSPTAPAPPTVAPVNAVSGPVRVSETTIVLQTYGYEAGFLPTTPDDPAYPYPRLDPEKVGPSQPRSYRAVVLENDYVSLTILPELGGRIYRWVDKATGRHLLYENPVVKPTGWGYRGWWLAAGGIEWAFPVEEHGLNEWRPWASSVRTGEKSTTIIVSDVEDRTGMTVGVDITLAADHSYVTLAPWVRNTSSTAQPFEYWLNAMVTLGDNRVSGDTHFIIPASSVVIHSTGDESLPDAWQPMAWPIYEGRDLSIYGAWQSYLGFFAPQVTHGFVALYDTAAEQGIVRSFTPGWPVGTKIFGPGNLPSWLWTDDDSGYVELWSGITPVFGDTRTLAAGDSVGWTERWYPVHNLGDVTGASERAALNLKAAEGSIEIGCAVSSPTQGSLTLWSGGEPIETWDVSLTPLDSMRTTWTPPAGVAGDLGLSMTSLSGERLAESGAVP